MAVRNWRMWLFAAPLLALAAVVVNAQQTNIDVLRIGSSGSLNVVISNEQEALKSLQDFIKEQTGFNNEIVQQKDWQELAQKMAQKQLHLGYFQGFEFAWAQERQRELKPLALAVNVYVNPVVYVVAQRDGPKDFGALQGQTLALPRIGQAYSRLFLAKEARDQGKNLDAFFGKIAPTENIEDALDNVVDGEAQAAATDRQGLEAYKRRKPGRFNRLKEIAHSQPLPPPLVAYCGSILDTTTLDRFRQGLLNSSNSDRGQTLLTLFRLTGFSAVPNDFDRILEDTRRNYPPDLLSH